MKKFSSLSLFIPLLVMFAWVIDLELTKQNSPEVRFTISGYDPRDLLSGHYLRFRINYGFDNICVEQYGENCLVIGKDAEHNYYKGIWSGPCNNKPAQFSDNIYLKGYCSGSMFTANIERYYISEASSAFLQSIPQNASIALSINKQGKALVKQMYVNDITVEEYASGLKENTHN